MFFRLEGDQRHLRARALLGGWFEYQFEHQSPLSIGRRTVMPKRLVVCCDGTWNTADQAIAGEPCPTNVTKLALSIAPEDSARDRQCVYYHSGAGTGRWERLRGGA